uniref:Protein kinase domain-containing protein n=2 Tax=Macrostomum lignano TaxID=282301 RepID=A0A1I8JCH2_9PLAT
MSVLSEESGSSVLTGDTGDTEDFWNKKKESLRSLKQTVRNGKRNLLIKRTTPAFGRSPGGSYARQRQQQLQQQQQAKRLSTIHEPRTIDHSNYRNYLRRRFPHITGNGNRRRSTKSPASSLPENDDDDVPLSEYASVVRPSGRLAGGAAAAAAAATSASRPSMRLKPGRSREKSDNLEDDTLESYIYFCENRQFAYDFVDGFINQHLDEDEIPDVLIDSVSSLREPPQFRQPRARDAATTNGLDSARSNDSGVGGFRGRRVGFRGLQPLPPVQRGAASAAGPVDDGFNDDLNDEDSPEVAEILRAAAAARHRDQARRRVSSPTLSSQSSLSLLGGRRASPRDATSVDAMQQLFREILPDIMRDVASEAVVEISQGIVNKIDIVDIMAPHILDETLNELIVELCSDYHYDIFIELVDELVMEYGPGIARKAVGEDFLDSLLDELVEPVADAMAAEVAADLLAEYDTRLRRRDLKEIKRTAKEKPLETLIFQQLIEKLAQGDSLLITSGTLHHFVEATELDILLKQLNQVARARRLTLESQPVRALHQRLFTDAALGVITDELLDQVDADLADLDFDEVEDARQKRSVAKAMDTVLQRRVAIKKLSKPFYDPEYAKRTYREMYMLAYMDHPNIICLIDVYSPQLGHGDLREVYLVTPWMDADLKSVLKQYNKLSEEHVRFFAYQMLLAIRYLHSVGILHRDIKPPNLAITEDNDFKILDFGLARKLEEQLTGYVVTRWYRSPEVLLNWEHYGLPVDMWAAGCVIGEMLLGKPLFPGEDAPSLILFMCRRLGKPSEEMMAKIQSPSAAQFIRDLEVGEVAAFEDLFPEASDGMIELLRRLLQFDPDRRATADEALQLPIFAEFASETAKPRNLPREPLNCDFEGQNYGVADWKRLVEAFMGSFTPKLSSLSADASDDEEA